MEVANFLFNCIIGFIIGLLFVILIEIRETNQNVENKINGNCIYVNNEFYCKD